MVGDARAAARSRGRLPYLLPPSLEDLLAQLAAGDPVLVLQKTGAGHFGDGVWTTVLLLCAGPLTVAPLALFAWAARRLPLVALGFLQFIAPTLQFFVGVASGEAFTPLRALAFGFIWIGAAVFAFGAWRRTRRLAIA